MVENRKFGIIKTKIDAHTMGISNVTSILKECGYEVVISNNIIGVAIERISNEKFFEIIYRWIVENRITDLCLSYRLDPSYGAKMMSLLIKKTKEAGLFSTQKSSLIRKFYFAGLEEGCILIKRDFKQIVETFIGDEDIEETLNKFNVPKHLIPSNIIKNNEYDKELLKFGNYIIDNELDKNIRLKKEFNYNDLGTRSDNIVKRIEDGYKRNLLPLYRAHIGPYCEDRFEALKLFKSWLKTLVSTKKIDIVSIGSSQLTQERFNKSWIGFVNGGGVPIKTTEELFDIYNISRPLLLRAYSATTDIVNFAKILDMTINNAWHALSIWWFNELDGRGPLGLSESIKEHLSVIDYLSKENKILEVNTSHHFSFRGGDDVTSIISVFLSALYAKRRGVKVFVLQNMLNTPKGISAINDLAKSRVLLKLFSEITDKNFRVIYQPRAGLGFFSPKEKIAKAQLGAVTAQMYDIQTKLELMHVVSYSEGYKLASPEILNNSINICEAVKLYYPSYKKRFSIQDIINSTDFPERYEALYNQSKMFINFILSRYKKLSFEVFFELFDQGYLPVPNLWNGKEKYPKAIDWDTQLLDGAIKLIDSHGKEITMNERINLLKNK